MKKKVTAIMIAMLSCVMLLTACGGNETVEEESSSSTVSVSSVASETEKVTKENVNLLTGVDDLTSEAIGKRPIAVMINNIDVSLPQYGIYDADLIFETLVEGGITRMMAVYGDYTQVPNIASIRSCRYYYPILAEGLDAIYIHCGYDKTIAWDTLQRLGTDRIDDSIAPEIMYRDQERLQQYDLEHTMMLEGSGLPETIDNLGYRTDLKKDKTKPIFDFNDVDEVTKPGDGKNKCEEVTLNFSDWYWSTFTYNKGEHVYEKQHNGNPHMDSVAGKQLAFTNLFVLETEIESRDDHDRQNVALEGGKGYYFSEGCWQEIKWAKGDDENGITIKDTDGKSVPVNTGKSYIAFIKPDCTVMN